MNSFNFIECNYIQYIIGYPIDRISFFNQINNQINDVDSIEQNLPPPIIIMER